MYKDLSTGSEWPKTLMVRNHATVMVWQVYHVKKQSEAEKLTYNANMNGFYGTTLEDHQPEIEETWPDWRETCDPNITL